MNEINIRRTSEPAATLIPNEFIDTYMPGANGEFVKIYLYFLRYSLCPGAGVSLSTAADTFSMTETDVLRALKYWEKEGLVRLTFTSGQLTELFLLPFESSGTVSSPQNSDSETTVYAQAAAAAASDGTSQPARQIYNGIPAYTMQELDSFRKNNNGDQLFFIIEQYLGKPLGPTDINTIVFFSEQLGFSSDLIEYLFEYCVSNNHYSIHYIEKTALAWAREGIDTVAKAKNRSAYYNKTCFDILKAFGITNRNPAKSEMEYIQRWTREYGFPMNLILEACRRTIEATHSPSFSYADSILKKWYDHNVGSMDDVKKLDSEYEEKRRQEKARNSVRKNDSTPNPSAARSGNRFHNFDQRVYNYSELEQTLINKTRQGQKPAGGN